MIKEFHLASGVNNKKKQFISVYTKINNWNQKNTHSMTHKKTLFCYERKERVQKNVFLKKINKNVPSLSFSSFLACETNDKTVIYHSGSEFILYTCTISICCIVQRIISFILCVCMLLRLISFSFFSLIKTVNHCKTFTCIILIYLSNYYIPILSSTL